MNYGGDIVRGIRELCDFFATHCEDRQTLEVLARVASDRALWHKGRALFEAARAKSRGQARESEVLVAQFRFEEICGKTLYNLSGRPAPFDADSPYWVVPNALKLARALGVSESEVTSIVAG
jgi:hypothetical protein